MLTSLSIGSELDQVPTDTFEATSGVHGTNAEGSPWLYGIFDAAYSLDLNAGTAAPQGLLEIRGVPACATSTPLCNEDYVYGAAAWIDCLLWPPDSMYGFDFYQCGSQLPRLP